MTIKIRNTQQSLDHLTAIALVEKPHTEKESFLAEHMLNLGFEMLNDDGIVFGCTLGQVVKLLEERLPAESPEHVLWEECCERAQGMWRLGSKEGKWLAFTEEDVVKIGDALRSMDHKQQYVSAGYQYKFPHATGGFVWRDTSDMYNSHRHLESREVFAKVKPPGRVYSKIEQPAEGIRFGGTYGKLADDYSNTAYKRFDFSDKLRVLEHDLYADGDADIPEQITDSNGQVVLNLCKVCGKGESELIDTPMCPGPKVCEEQPDGTINIVDPADKGNEVIRDSHVQAIPEPPVGLFHTAWGMAKERPDYDKKAFGYVQSLMDEARHATAEPGQGIQITSSNVAVDRGYLWNYDMGACPDAKVQLLGAGGIPQYGYKSQGVGFWKAWAPLPSNPK